MTPEKFDVESFEMGLNIGLYYRFWWILMITVLAFLGGLGIGELSC